MRTPVQPRYLNPEDASKYCGLSVRTLKRRIKEDCFKTFTKGRRVLILRESLDVWIERPQSEGMPQTVTPRWLSRKAASQYCGLSIPTIDRHIRNGTFPTQLAGRKRLIDREALDAWIGKVKPQSEPLRLHPDDIEGIAAAVVRLLRAP